MRWIVLLIFVICGVYTHYRGKVRHGFFRQLSDHSTFTSPLNCFVYLFSRVPSTPYLSPALFPELATLRGEWETIRAEALELQHQSKIQASKQFNDIGFNSFFRNGWRRFYL
jgi:beta-hydroxylase